MVVVLTGPIGGGKTTVLRILRSLGAAGVAADDEAHELLRRGDVRRQIRSVFGAGVFHGRYVSRKKLAREVFADPERLKRLEGIIYPLLTKHLREKIDRLVRRNPRRCVVVEAPLFHRAGWEEWFDAIVYVTAPLAVRKKRCFDRGLTPHEFNDRERCQRDIRLLRPRAKWMISTNRPLPQLKRSLRRICRSCADGRLKKGRSGIPQNRLLKCDHATNQGER